MENKAARIAVNLRTLGHFTTGVQRYLAALLPHMGTDMRHIAPGRSLQGISGHLWEQCILPSAVKKDLLWSPGNTGPLTIRKQVVTLHDASSLDHPEWFEGKFALWYAWMLPKLVRKSACLITVSAHAKSRIVDRLNLDEKKVIVIHNGVDPSFAPASDDAISELRGRLSLKAPFFLYVGSLEPRKNLSFLMEAWKTIKTKDFQLVVAGTSSHVFQRTGLVAAENVHFLGRVAEDDLATLYSAAHAFVFPSLYEGFGLPPLEAMACGCPALSSSTTSLPEVCGPEFNAQTQANGAVLYFDPADLDSIIHSIREMMECSLGKRQQMGESALSRASRFSWQTAADSTLEVLQRTLRHFD